MQSGVSSVLLIVWFVSAVAALYLLITGLRGRRLGDEPRCARCSYILLHLQSANCPECGSEITERTTVIGQRVRRPWRAAVGIVLLLICCLPLVSPVTSAIANIPWYQFKPAGWVVNDLDSPPIYLKAITELQRREKAGRLPGSIRHKLIEKGLQEQSASPTAARQEILDFLGGALLDGKLTPQQQDRFLDQACSLTMTVRPIIAEGDQVPFWVWFKGRGPGGDYPIVFWLRHEDVERRIDGKVVRRGTGSGTSGLTGGGGSGTTEPSGAVGKHQVEADVDFSVWYGIHGDQTQSRLIGRRKVTARAEYEVVERDKAPKIELLDSADLRKQVAAAVTLESFTQQKNGYLNAQFRMTNPPCDLAFDVFVVTEKGETRMGSINCGKGKTSSYGTGNLEPKNLPATVKVILRGSEEVAKRTVDLSAIYSGEITIENVEVKQENR